MQGNKGAARLAGTLTGLIDRQTSRPDTVGYGTIQPDGSLLLDRFQVPIPPDAYEVVEHLTLPNELAPGVPTPPALRKLAPGDRVVVGWCNDYTDPVVIGRPKSAKEVFP